MKSPEPPLDLVSIQLNDSFATYFASRARQHIHDSYVGIPMMKFPEALRTYEHLLWCSEANCVVELGCLHGGSTLWFRDRIESLRRYCGVLPRTRVIAVDKHIDSAREHIAKIDPGYKDTITLVSGDVCDPNTAATVKGLLPRDARCLVVEDSAHTFETTYASLVNFSGLVVNGCFFVVEDGYLDTALREYFSRAELELNGVAFGGVIDAITAWASTAQGAKFHTRPDWELYGLSASPNGILQRVVD